MIFQNGSYVLAVWKEECKSNIEIYNHYHRYWNPYLEGQKQIEQQPRLWLALLRYFGWTYLFHGVLYLVEVSI